MRVEIWADVLCPWCYIGKRRLAAALASLPGRDEVEIVWRAFELAPWEGREPGASATEAMAGWWGAEAPARIARIKALGAAEGLDLRLEAAHPVSTFDAHRLTKLAGARGRAEEMMEGLLHAYHVAGLNIADPAVLTDLATAAGLDAAAVADLLEGDRHAADVRADQARAAERAVTGVPTLVIDDGPPISGVQSPPELRRALETALNRYRTAHRPHV